jgi:hypothetical protein
MNEDHRFYDHEWVCGYKFTKWGLGFFLFGFLLGFGVLIHYLVGSSWNMGDSFLTNMTLWFGSPLSLSATYLQVGGLAMAIIGVAKKALAACNCCSSDRTTTTGTSATTATGTDRGYLSSAHHDHHGKASLMLCIIGLIALFVTGYIGYFIIDGIWPSFYYTPIVAGKNTWLVLQGLSLLVFFIGLIGAFCCLCKCRHCSHTHKH